MTRRLALACVSIAVVLASTASRPVVGAPQKASVAIPTYAPDPNWPPRLPNNWVMGVPTWVFVDKSDHVWILHRPRTAPKETQANLAPPVIELDNNGRFVQAWGGPGAGYDWPDTEHSIYIDYKDRVWITGINPSAGPEVSTRSDDMILKFTRNGKFIQQIGGRDISKGNKDTANPRKSAEVFVFQKTNEAFVADGYGNRRVWVIDADTGAYKRMWGAFSNEPLEAPVLAPGAPDPTRDILDGPGPPQWGIVHGTKVSNDGHVYVADRGNRRIQVFSLDGKYETQGFVNRKESNASCDTVAFSPDKDQTYLFCPDFNLGTVVVIDRKTLATVNQFGSRGDGPGQMQNPHTLAIDSHWNLYTAEVAPGRRLQRFIAKVPGRLN